MTTATAGRALAGLVLLVLAASAGASPGNGIRLGGSVARLHPYVELETRYDSNLTFSEQQEAVSGGILHIRPGLTLDSPGEKAAVNLKAELDWAQYLGENSDLSRLYGDAQLGVGVNRRGSIGLELSDAFRRSSSSSMLTLPAAVVENSNVLEVGVPWRPGGGAFVATLSGGWTLETFEPFSKGNFCDPANPAAGSPECDQSLLSDLGYSDVRGGLDLRWRFLPRTAAVLEGEYWKRLPANEEFGAKASGWRGRGGVAGLFSAHLAGTLEGGWGSVSDAPGSLSSWLANAELEWIPYETASVKGGWVRDVGVDPGQNAGYRSDRGYLDGHVLFAGRFTPQLKASYEHREYPESGGFAADLIVVEPSLDLELARWLRVGAGAAYTRRTSDLPAGTPALPGFDFHKTEAFARVRGTY